jgi:hypothetical protein
VALSAAPIVIGLSAVVTAIHDGEAVVLTVRPQDARTRKASTLPGLPSGPFDPAGQRTFELALRAFVSEQTGFRLGYVEQLYTFGDEGRDAPLADLGGAPGDHGRIISVGYLALTPEATEATLPGAQWTPWPHFFPYEDWRGGRPAVIDETIAPALRAWAGRGRGDGAAERRLARARSLFALDGHRWNEERVLDRFELLYEAGLAPEAARDRQRATGHDAPEPSGPGPSGGEPMVSDHRRILATGLARLRGKIKYRPVVFELMGPTFTLSALQRTVEAIAGVALHKQNFRRMALRTGLVEGLGSFDDETGGRPAELFRFRREAAAAAPASGLSLPMLRE